MPITSLVSPGGTSNNGAGPIALFNGRISRTASNQNSTWGALTFEMDATLYTDVGSIYGNLENGDVVVDDTGMKYRVIGRARAFAWGSLDNFFSYPLKSITTI